MKAAIRRKYCGPKGIEIESIPRPIPKDDEVLVKIRATSVNRTDCANLTAHPFIMRFVLGLIKPQMIILGTDFAGDVVSVGKKVSLFKKGARVFGFNDMGAASHAEWTTVKEQDVFSIPCKIDYNQAAASLEGAHYAHAFIHKVQIQSGQSVLINGATGGIGSALLQFVRQYDVTITASSNGANISLIKDLGADAIYDYSIEDFTKRSTKYDFIFDTVGKSSFRKCKALLKKNGVYISSELGPYFQNVFYPLLTKASSKKVIFPIPYSRQETIAFISHLLDTGKFKPVIDRTYTFEDIVEAYGYVISGKKTGNVLIEL